MPVGADYFRRPIKEIVRAEMDAAAAAARALLDAGRAVGAASILFTADQEVLALTLDVSTPLATRLNQALLRWQVAEARALGAIVVFDIWFHLVPVVPNEAPVRSRALRSRECLFITGYTPAGIQRRWQFYDRVKGRPVWDPPDYGDLPPTTIVPAGVRGRLAEDPWDPYPRPGRPDPPDFITLCRELGVPPPGRGSSPEPPGDPQALIDRLAGLGGPDAEQPGGPE